jgi:hypothetical protein
MSMTILLCLKGLCGAAALAGAMAALQAPVEARHPNSIHLAASSKTDATTHKQIKSVPPRKRSRCNG